MNDWDGILRLHSTSRRVVEQGLEEKGYVRIGAGLWARGQRGTGTGCYVVCQIFYSCHCGGFQVEIIGLNGGLA